MKFNYKAPPTVARFMRSDAPMRVIMGPQGCLSADTEFLTSRGWKRMDAYAAGDDVAEWHAGEVYFREPSEYHVLPCESFIAFRNEHSLSMVLSDEHSVPHWNWAGEFKVRPAAQLAKKPSKTTIPVSFKPRTYGVNLTEYQVRLLVAQHADGYIDSSRATVITVRKERKKIRLRELLGYNGIEFKERAHAQRPTESIFRFRWPFTSKQYAPWWYGLDAQQLRCVIDEATQWDGMCGPSGTVFYSRHKSDADFIQYAAHATGGRATISRVEQRDAAWADNYAVHIAREGSPKAKVMLRGDNTTITRVPSVDGRKYCFTTSTGFFVARHNGCIFVTGNSGKSSGSCVEALRRSITRRPDSDGKRRAKFAIVRNTVPMLKDTTIPTFLRWFPHGTLGSWHATDKMYHFKFADVDAQVLFRALDDADDVAKLLSAEYTGCYFNEFREIDPVIYEAMTKRVGRWVTDPEWTKTDIDAAWYGIWADTNPPQVESWHHQMMEKAIPNSWDVFKQPSGRSPEAENTEHLRSDYYSTDGLTEEYIRVMIDGEYGYDQSGLPVFGKTFMPDWHVQKGEPLRLVGGTQYPLLIGLDAGLKPAAVLGQLDYKTRLSVVGECYVKADESMGMERFLTTMLNPYLRTHFPSHKPIIIVDPAARHRGQANEITPFDIIQRYHTVQPAPSNDVQIRIGAGETWLMGQVEGKPKVLFDTRTPFLQSAIAHGYRFEKRKNTGVSMGVETKPLPDKTRHASNIADAFTYLCLYASGGQQYSGAQSQARPIEVVSSRGWT